LVGHTHVVFNDEKAHSVRAPHTAGLAVEFVPDYATATHLRLDGYFILAQRAAGKYVDASPFAFLGTATFQRFNGLLGSGPLRQALRT
jgi:hypothetical protein